MHSRFVCNFNVAAVAAVAVVVVAVAVVVPPASVAQTTARYLCIKNLNKIAEETT